MTTQSWVITTADGLDDLLADEVTALGATKVIKRPGALLVDGDLAFAYRVCLWSRLATRVLMPLLSVPSGDPDKLYQSAKKFNWSRVLRDGDSLYIRAAASKGVATHTKFVSQRLKDAIADHCREKTGERPNIDAEQPDLSLHVFVEEQSLSVSVDFSGDSLHKRGYRVAATAAPMKETLAAALLMMSGWPKQTGPRLLDPLCGSGTILIEAAMMAADIAPGLLRLRFGFEGWAGHDSALWLSLRNEAVARRLAGLQQTPPEIYGFDADAKALRSAQRNAQVAGVAGWIRWAEAELAKWSLPESWGAESRGVVVTNPPYGERLGDDDSIKYLYRGLGRKLRQQLPGWSAVVLAAHIEHADALGLEHRHTQRLFNGALPIFARVGGVLPEPTEPDLAFNGSLEGVPEEALAFANRLVKNTKQFLRLAEQEDVRCFRLYDADLPEFNLAIDVYDGRLHVQEYAPPKQIDAEKAQARFRMAVNTLRHVLGVHRDKVFLKVRERQTGKRQYEKQAKKGKFYEVREGEAYLLVNLTEYLDTGLFLDHRPMRQRIHDEAAGKHVLNLFAYTGSVSVQAAMGGALSTTTIDLSPTYLLWAERNLALNGFAELHHDLIQADVMAWLEGEAQADEPLTYDLIFIDPPTFSNSKRSEADFDVQRDHPRMLRLAMQLLAPGGTLYFSNNFRKFELDSDLAEEFGMVDISAETIGFDFQRNAKIHRCWRISAS